jgi:hypothetical protein
LCLFNAKIKECEDIVEKLVNSWKSVLGISDWFVVVKDNCCASEFNSQDCAGECEWDIVHKCAVIRLLREEEYGDRIIPYDKEKILVHELLHIKFAIIDNSGNGVVDNIIHQIIEDMAKALVHIKRQGGKKRAISDWLNS